MHSGAAVALDRRPTVSLGRAWLALCLALAIHVVDETLTGFLAVWNPTTIAIRQRLPWYPMPVFRFDVWLGGLIFWVCAGLAIAPVFFRGGGRLRPIGWIVGVLMIGNGIGHILGTILGRTVASIHFPRPMPGFYSSPLLLVAAGWLIVELRKSRGHLTSSGA